MLNVSSLIPPKYCILSKIKSIDPPKMLHFFFYMQYRPPETPPYCVMQAVSNPIKKSY